jgi:hypothetical protein
MFVSLVTNEVQSEAKLVEGTPHISINLTPTAASHFTLDGFNTDSKLQLIFHGSWINRLNPDVYPSSEALKLVAT